MTPRFSEYSDIPDTRIETMAPIGKSDHIRRAERKEEEARALMREAAYLRDLAKRLEVAGLEPPKCPHGMSSPLRCSTCNGY